MLTEKELLATADYLLTRYQNEIFRQLHEYMEGNHLSQKDMAKKLGVSNAYISQVLNGNFNFTLKKLIELGLAIGKIPRIEFVGESEFLASKTAKKSIPMKPVYPKKHLVKLAK